MLSGIDAQLLVSGGSGNDTTIVDDSNDAHDVLGTLTQTSLVGLGMTAGTQSRNLFSLELSAGLAGVTFHIVAHRAATPDAPGLDIDVTFTLCGRARGPHRGDARRTAPGRAFPAGGQRAAGPGLPGDDDRFATTGCGTNGTTGEPDSLCSSSVFVWKSATTA